MIRIDEIYYNIFLPKLQERPFHGLHWFDPFGSVKFKHLCSVPPVPWDDRAVRYLFWDQEPLHPETVDRTLAEFKAMYNGQHHLITSERNSEFVERACDTYGFISHYYFFHGWAALDWFRGYDHSFLIARARDRNPTQTFMSPNRIVAGKRDHRVLFLYNIYRQGLENNHISAPRMCQYEGVDISIIAQKYANIYQDITEVLNAANLPRLFAGEAKQQMHSYQLGNFIEAQDSLVYVPTETVYFGRRLHLTEKTFKAIALEMPFVLVATAGSLAYLREYGFRTFDSVFDESYDLESDDVRRIERVTQLLKDLDDLSVHERQQIHHACLPIVEHNYKHFYGGGFADILWKEITGMLEGLHV
jgi:hypothetical protein